MHFRAILGASLAVITLTAPAVANQDVIQQTADPSQWVLQTGDYANQRYSKLNQITGDKFVCGDNGLAAIAGDRRRVFRTLSQRGELPSCLLLLKESKDAVDKHDRTNRHSI